jgi:hypothetical protein
MVGVVEGYLRITANLLNLPCLRTGRDPNDHLLVWSKGIDCPHLGAALLILRDERTVLLTGHNLARRRDKFSMAQLQSRLCGFRRHLGAQHFGQAWSEGSGYHSLNGMDQKLLSVHNDSLWRGLASPPVCIRELCWNGFVSARNISHDP